MFTWNVFYVPRGVLVCVKKRRKLASLMCPYTLHLLLMALDPVFFRKVTHETLVVHGVQRCTRPELHPIKLSWSSSVGFRLSVNTNFSPPTKKNEEQEKTTASKSNGQNPREKENLEIKLRKCRSSHWYDEETRKREVVIWLPKIILWKARLSFANDLWLPFNR